MKQFAVSATGGTFDILHKGHIALLAKSFELSDNVIIGLCGDRMAAKRGKKPIHAYGERLENLHHAIKENFPDAKYQISRLDDDFGPAVLKDGIDALITSQDTSHKGKTLNLQRAQRKLKPVAIIVVPMVKAYDGGAISSTRIRKSEIDSAGSRR